MPSTEWLNAAPPFTNRDNVGKRSEPEFGISLARSSLPALERYGWDDTAARDYFRWRQLEKAGVIDVFERRFSVDETVRRHKPAPEAYHSVASELDLEPGDICLIACHVWDTLGALAAGWQAGLILREGNAPLEVGPQPNYIGDDLDAIADQLIERYPASAMAAAGRSGH